MSATKGIFISGMSLANSTKSRIPIPLACCGSMQRYHHRKACASMQKPKIDHKKAQVQELKARGFLSQEVAGELKMKLGDVNKLWL